MLTCIFLEAGDSEFYELLDIWFPEKQPLPTAFLVDTSEEALLLPDWLKLRMIRSEVPRLVDAGMHQARTGRGEGPVPDTYEPLGFWEASSAHMTSRGSEL